MHCAFKETCWTVLSDQWRATLQAFPCLRCCRVLFELIWSKDIFLIWIRVHLFLLLSESLLCFSFSFCPHFIHYVSQTHTALSACCCCCFCRWHFTARQQIAFCWVLLHHTSTSKRTHATTTCTYSRTSDIIPLLFFLSCVWHCFLFVILFLHFMFCWQLNGTGRFHGLASLDDITAIISTPPLGGFQVATPTSPKSVVENDQLKAIEQDEP